MGGYCAHAVDFNGNGWQDLVVCGNARIHLYRNDAGTGFTDVTAALGLASFWRDAELADLNGDGLLDIVMINVKSVVIRLRKPDGTFAPPIWKRTLLAGRAIALGDINRDGHLDVYLLQGASSTVPKTPTTCLQTTGSAPPPASPTCRSPRPPVAAAMTSPRSITTATAPPTSWC